MLVLIQTLYKEPLMQHRQLYTLYNFILILYTTLYFIQLYTLYNFILYTTLYFIQLYTLYNFILYTTFSMVSSV